MATTTVVSANGIVPLDEDTAHQAFHQHVDGCRQCTEHPMQLCDAGHALLLAACDGNRRAALWTQAIRAEMRTAARA